ncbi:MAG: O-antigen ligase family protein [Patescibacteria group bacterium]
MRPLLLSLLIFCLPFQLGYHFWPGWSFVSGFRIDYLSPTIYFTDLIAMVYILVCRPKLPKYLTLLFITFALLNTNYSSSIPLTFFSWLHLSLYLVLFFSFRTEKDLIAKIQKPLLLSTVLIISIELLQFLKQSSLDGIFYFLGERPFNSALPNIAKLDILNHFLVRPYSTFSHPNSLAGYLLILYLLLPRLRKLIILAIILTFSKAAILALVLIQFPKRLYKPILVILLIISLSPLIFTLVSVPFIQSSSILSRLYSGSLALPILQKNPIFGVGLNNYIPVLANALPTSYTFISSLQPVHSVSLLILSELGLVGFVSAVVIIKKFLTQNSQLLILLATTAAVDHYWWTLPQNKLILVLILALMISKKANAKS